MNFWHGIALAPIFGAVIGMETAIAQPALKVVYPPANHETTADRIFLIGTAPAAVPVTVNGQLIRERSPAGHFAPSFPLQLGENRFTVVSQGQTLQLTVKRRASTPIPPEGLAFAPDSLTPAVDIARQPNEPICFSAIAPPNAQVTVTLGGQTLALTAQPQAVTLPENSAVLTQSGAPAAAPGLYQGCTTFATPAELGVPRFSLRQRRQTTQQAGKGQVTILSPQTISVVSVTSDQGVARTGPGTDYSRLTPLPKGTQAQVTAREGEWLRLDYGGWIKQSETQPLTTTNLPRSLIRSVQVKTRSGWTDVIFPLQVPVPVTLQQGDDHLVLTLYNTTAQTDTILQTPDPMLSRLDWQQTAPGQVQYRFQLKTRQQWGYQLRYEGTSLLLSLRHPPRRQELLRYGNLRPTGTVVTSITILLDPGHGSANDLGSVGPTGYPEKDVALAISQKVKAALEQRGFQVIMTREGDDDLYPQDRVNRIEKVQPTLALSLHYNALPDNGDAWNTQGVSAFWYQPQSQSLAVFLHDYLVQKLNRPSYGVYWNNLALTRPAIAPAVLLELGFMINPVEFEWIVDPKAQQQLATTIADGIGQWLQAQSNASGLDSSRH
jgi:N-acetylmuramoyl-L-alanine amidase